MAPTPPGLAAIPTFDYPRYALVVLAVSLLAAGLAYLLGRRRRLSRPLALPAVALVLAGLALVPAPQPDTAPHTIDGELTGETILRVQAADGAPIQVTGGHGEGFEENGTNKVELRCPDGCSFQLGSSDEEGAWTRLASRTVVLEGGPLSLRSYSYLCVREPWVFNLGELPCYVSGGSFLEAPEGSNGTVRLNSTGGVAT